MVTGHVLFLGAGSLCARTASRTVRTSGRAMVVDVETLMEWETLWKEQMTRSLAA
jgi:hypothetical protein